MAKVPSRKLSGTNPRDSSHSNLFIELLEGDWPIDIVATMFCAGWPLEKTVVIKKILKVNHSLDLLTEFEEYGEPRNWQSMGINSYGFIVR